MRRRHRGQKIPGETAALDKVFQRNLGRLRASVSHAGSRNRVPLGMRDFQASRSG